MLEAFPPVADGRSRLLVLGSMPGAVSLAKRQYYGHPRNALWPILYRLLAAREPDESYEQRVDFALAHGVALWDVLRACEREGSLDSAIREPEANEFGAFFARYPGIRHIIFNGKAAAELFRRHVKLPPPPAADGTAAMLPLTLHTLPSTSPALTMPLDRKCQAWAAAFEAAGLRV